MSDLSKYRIWCTTDSKYEYKWQEASEAAPTTCPTDTAHTIDAAKTAIVESVSTQLVALDPNEKHVTEIQEVSPGPLGYRAAPIEAVISIGASPLIVSKNFSWLYDFHLLSIEYWAGTGSSAVLGDKISACVDCDRNLTDFLSTAGEVQEAEVTTDAEVLIAAASIASGFLQPGYFVKFAGAGNPEYEIIAIDKVTNLMTLDRDLDNARAAGDDIFRTIPMGKDLWVMPSECPVNFGTTKIGASRIPAGWVLKITYEAVDANGREIYVNAEGGIYEA